jgi:hypothetical protein
MQMSNLQLAFIAYCVLVDATIGYFIWKGAKISDWMEFDRQLTLAYKKHFQENVTAGWIFNDGQGY